MSRPFSAALLAGGRSRRMGTDKAFLDIGDPPRPLWQRQLALLAELEPAQLLLSHNADQAFRQLPTGVEMVVDSASDSGPLGALASCLRRTSCEHLLILAVDLPSVSPDLLRRLLDHDGGVVLRDPNSQRFEPVAAVYPRACLAIAEEQLSRGELAMQSFIAICIAGGWLAERPLDEADRAQLKNLNRPEDLRAAGVAPEEISPED